MKENEFTAITNEANSKYRLKFIIFARCKQKRRERSRVALSLSNSSNLTKEMKAVIIRDERVKMNASLARTQ